MAANCDVDSPAEFGGVLLTGASSEIGQVLAQRFAQRRNLKLLATSFSRPCPPELSSREHTLVLDGVDLTCRADIESLALAVDKFFDGPFGIVHSVGTFWEHKAIPLCSLEEARDLMSTHYLTLYGVLNSLLPIMSARGGGRIVAFSCTSVGSHYPEMAAFTSVKAAVECLIRCTANEWSEHRIAANAIALSTISTPKVMQLKPLASEENYVSREEVGALVEDVLFSSSPFLSGNIIRPLKHSHTFYNRAYFERNPRGVS